MCWKLLIQKQNQCSECIPSYQYKHKINIVNKLKVINANTILIYWMCLKLSMQTQNQYNECTQSYQCEPKINTECAQSYQCKPKFNVLNVLKVINTNPKSIYWMCSKLSIKTQN